MVCRTERRLGEDSGDRKEYYEFVWTVENLRREKGDPGFTSENAEAKTTAAKIGFDIIQCCHQQNPWWMMLMPESVDLVHLVCLNIFPSSF